MLFAEKFYIIRDTVSAVRENLKKLKENVAFRAAYLSKLANVNITVFILTESWLLTITSVSHKMQFIS